MRNPDCFPQHVIRDLFLDTRAVPLSLYKIRHAVPNVFNKTIRASPNGHPTGRKVG